MDFFQSLGSVILPYTPYIAAIAAMFTRLSAMIFMLPGLGESSIPVRVRLITALVITWLLVPFMIDDFPVVAGQPSAFAALIFVEAMYGFVLGFSFRILIFVLQIAGTIIAQAMSLSQIFGNILTEEPNPTISLLLMMAATTLLLTMDFHVEALRVLLKSYETFPMGSTVDTEQLAFWATKKAVGAFDFALSLSLPFVILNFVYNVMLGVINRAMPQLMVSFVGLPAITGAGLALLAVSIAGILMVWLSNMNQVFTQTWGF